MSGSTDHTPIEAKPVERVAVTERQMRARRARSIALGVVLVALVVLFYVVTLDKLGMNLVSVDAMRDL